MSSRPLTELYGCSNNGSIASGNSVFLPAVVVVVVVVVAAAISCQSTTCASIFKSVPGFFYVILVSEKNLSVFHFFLLQQEYWQWKRKRNGVLCIHKYSRLGGINIYSRSEREDRVCSMFPFSMSSLLRII